jgi:hypothetical protein
MTACRIVLDCVTHHGDTSSIATHRRDEMDDAAFKKMTDEFESKKSQAERIAQMKAMDYVGSGNEEDRHSAKNYLAVAELWREAVLIARKHRSAA